MDGHEGWQRLAAVAEPVDPATAGLLRRGQVPGAVQRVLLPLLWTALQVLVVISVLTADYDPCTAADPCLPDPGFAFQEGLLLGVAVLVWGWPRVGMPAAALLGVADVVRLVLDPEAPLLAAALVGAFLVALTATVLQVRARRAPLPPAPTSGPLPATGRERLVSRGWGGVEVVAVLLLGAAVALVAFYGVTTARILEREARAQDTTVRVVAVDDEDWVLTVELPDGTQADVGVYEIELYAVGDPVPAAVAPAEGPDDQPWVSLQAEPREQDGWLVLAGAAAALGVGLAWRRSSSLRARERLLRDGGPVWVTQARPDDEGAHVDLHALRLRARYTRTSPADAALEGVGLLRQQADDHDLDDLDDLDEDDDLPPELRGLRAGTPEWDEAVARLDEREDDEERETAADVVAMQSAFALAWREARLPADWDEEDDDTPDDAWLAHRLPAGVQAGDSERVLLVGDPRPGGHVLVVTHDSLVAPFTPLEPALRLSGLLDWWQARRRAWLPPDPGAPTAAPVARDRHGLDDDGLDATGLPGVPAARLPAGTATAVSPDVVHLRPPPWRRAGWAVLLLVPVLFWLLLTGDADWWTAAWTLLGLGGTLLWGLSYTVSGVRLSPDEVQVRGGFMVDVHPWAGVVGARVVDDEVVLAFGLDEDGDLLAAGGRPVQGAPAQVAVLAERWRLAAAAPVSEASWRVPDGTGTTGPDDTDELLERPLFPEPGRRHPDPAVATVLVLYAVAAAAVVAWPYVV